MKKVKNFQPSCPFSREFCVEAHKVLEDIGKICPGDWRACHALMSGQTHKSEAVVRALRGFSADISALEIFELRPGCTLA
ncbi:MAG: hypothetical protein WC107_06945 [Patescibacteria group bacterium]